MDRKNENGSDTADLADLRKKVVENYCNSEKNNLTEDEWEKIIFYEIESAFT